MSKRTQYLQDDGSRKYNAPQNPPGACALVRVSFSELFDGIRWAWVFRLLLASSIVYLVIVNDRVEWL